MTRAIDANYHHGDLRNALVDAAAAKARERGPAGVVLREVLREIGVSHNAAYRHFADRAELLEAVRDRALDQLAEAMRAGVAGLPAVGDGPDANGPDTNGPDGDAAEPVARAMARLHAVGLAYIQFALAEPGFFRTAFFTGAELADPAAADAGRARARVTSPELMGLESPYQILRGCVADMVAADIVPAERAQQTEIGAWSAVHGLATLLLDSPLATVGPEVRMRRIEAVLALVNRGV
ncbi:MAG: TetR/AcrR family transcriptional regulator [Frankiaceae bacterium]|nr:TetR/AcrR family transcriptional regulator [Frankiaceae bacterium]